ncbi:MAG: ABC transporter permease [Caldilineales bacterium]|nr:ABC transporter permease [Caldilineales bacterium]
MTNYLIRRIIQMMLVVLLAALFTYFLFNISPGGPLAGIQQQQQRLTREDLARLRAQYELDLYWPFRFSRWLIGLPNGPITIGGRDLFANTAVGCYLPRDEQIVIQDGQRVVTPAGCDQYVYLADIPELHPAIRSSNGILRGDFGRSTVIRTGQPVWGEMMTRLPATLELMLISTFLSFLIGIPIGIYSAIKQYSRFDYTFTTISFIGSAMPTFFFGLMLILVFTVFPNLLQDQFPWLPKLPPGSRLAVRPYAVAEWLPRVQPGTGMDRFLHLLMPVGVLTFFYMATWSRFVRSSMLEVMRQDYVRTARAKGLVEKVVIVKHALRNALIPFVTVAVLTIPGFFSGAIITETVFAWPGMGRLYYEALNRSDWPIALAFIFITAVLTVFATLLGDILYTVVDPRIKYT